MRTSSARIGRINDVIQRDLAKLIRDKCKDPRLGMVTISGVEVASNIAHAKVFVTVLEDNKITQSLAVLNKAAGFLRTELAHLTLLRIVPKLQFIYDDTILKSIHLNNLIDSTCVSADDNN